MSTPRDNAGGRPLDSSGTLGALRSPLALVGLVSLSLAACAPATGTGDSAAPVDAVDALEAGPDAQEPRDVVTVDEAPALEASTPDVRSDAPPADALTCATDMDRDGFIAASCGGNDCDDADPLAHPRQGAHCGHAQADANCDGTPDAEQAEQQQNRCTDDILRMFPSADPSEGSFVPECRNEAPNRGCKACTRLRCVCWVSGASTSIACPR